MPLAEGGYFFLLEAESLAELKYMVDDYMEHYNNTRKQWTLKKNDSGSIPKSFNRCLM